MTGKPLMRTINKQTEPACLAQLRREARRIETDTSQPPKGDDWDPGDCADSIRASLHVEQGGLCAYCMECIKPHGYRSNQHNRGGMKIEHWHARSEDPRRMYDWDNLLGVCGGECHSRGILIEHCDTSRKNTPLYVNPGTSRPPRPEDVFTFKSEPPCPNPGHRQQGIWVHARDPKGVRDIDTLNLNAEHLVKNRHSALENLRNALGAAGSESSVRKLLRKRLTTATKPGPNGLPRFAPLVADYIRRKMRAKGMNPP